MQEKKGIGSSRIVRLLVLAGFMTLVQGGALGVFSGSAMAAQNVTDENLAQMLRQVLREKPELVMDVLRQNSETILDIAQQGSTVRRKRALESQWREDFKVPKKAALDGRPVLGAENAPVTIVAFSDFTCPYCVQGAQTVRQLLQQYDKKVRYIFKHMPGGKDTPSRLASEYVVAAGLQSQEKAWKLYEVCFDQRERLSTEGEAFLKEAAGKLGLNVQKLTTDAKGKKVKDIIEEDLADAKRLGIEGTPYFLVNDLVVRGALPLELFRGAVDMALEKSGKK